MHYDMYKGQQALSRNRKRMSDLLKRIWGKPSIMIRTGSHLAPPKSSSKRKRVTKASPTRNVRPSTAPTAAAPSQQHGVRPSHSNITSLSSDYIWEYEDGQRYSTDWKPYTIQDAMKLERTITATPQTPQSTVVLTHPWATYEVQMPPTYPYGEQRNTSTGFRRRVRRREVKALQCPNCNKIFRSTCK